MTFEKKPFNNPLFDVNPSDLFKDFGRQFFEQFPGNTSIKTDVKELDDQYVVEAELPGFEKENITLEFENNLLTIEGKQTTENKSEDDNGQVIHQERSVNDVKRQFTFNNVDENAIKAAYDKGVLNVILPKKTVIDESKTNIQID
ncbi:heat-shock protein [Staphylococcus casei]|uniref:Hsp20/alpha crystallin family protein n=1 Tax=Staphylococcus TaxID=1279 RepID=UPI000CD1BD5B|nr:Hsp20/alpha crystallin family protein [Staphylococcus casei]PNZ60169.1 heat-shock protein [Staphylococcus casei]PTI78820.1 Hsp20/alpha crystallin family protein [Staphylococcus succinus]WJE86907.1 Hsp20/alpha crystallin family protein [Staphylococcus casei]